MTDYDVFAFDTTVQPFITWLTVRLKQGKRDKIDNLARRMIADRRLPRQASKSMFLAQLRSKGYGADDLQVLETAWTQFRVSQENALTDNTEESE